MDKTKSLEAKTKEELLEKIEQFKEEHPKVHRVNKNSVTNAQTGEKKFHALIEYQTAEGVADDPGDATDQEVSDAIKALHKEGNKDNFTAKGLPNVSAISDHLEGKVVTADQRDAAWKAFDPNG